MYYTDNDFRLYHSWGTSPKQKAREKEYNAWYYQHNKEKWKQYAENARRAAGNVGREITGAAARDRMLAERRHAAIAGSARAANFNTKTNRNYAKASVNYQQAFKAWYNHPVVRAQRAIQRGRNLLNGIIRGAKTAVRNVANRAEWAGRKAVNTVRNYSATVQAANDRKKRLNSSGSQALRSQTNAYNTTRPLNRNRG